MPFGRGLFYGLTETIKIKVLYLGKRKKMKEVGWRAYAEQSAGLYRVTYLGYDNGLMVNADEVVTLEPSDITLAMQLFPKASNEDCLEAALKYSLSGSARALLNFSRLS